MSNSVVHLHVHTDYSILDGHSRLPAVVGRAAELHQPALAMTDHGSLGGARKFWSECNSHGIKPIIGCEFYVAPGSRLDHSPVYWGHPEQRRDDVSGQGAYCHLTILSTGDEGLRNLFRLHAASYADGFYRKPRIDIDLLREHSRGLVVTSGCAGGPVATLIRLGKIDAAKDYLTTLRDIFEDRFFIEIMRHDNPVDAFINGTLIQLSRRNEIPLVATNDSHYTTEDDGPNHDALLCLQTGQRLDKPRTFQFEGTGYHLRSAEEMAAKFGDLPEALKNTLAIAEMVEPYTVFDHTLRMPKYSETADIDIQEMCNIAGYWFSEEHQQRITYELETITGMGYSDYFLILADLVNTARAASIRIGPGRGSVGGSAVAFALGIHQLDPIEHNLLFERFLNPERISLPDIDIDIDDSRRDEFLGIVREKYGEEYVAQIATYGIIGSKSSLHDAARVSGFSRRLSDGLTSRLPPPKFGRMPRLADGDWRGLTNDEQATLSLAEGLDGVIRNQGTHAAGVVISPEPLRDVVPLFKAAGKGPWVTAWDMQDIEAVGLVKMDFLGLQNLGVIDECLHMLGNREDSGSLREVPTLSTNLDDLTDTKTFELLGRGDTPGIFQLDGSGMQQLLRSIKPTHFGDISAVLALYRPGPMGVNAHHSYAKRKNGKDGISFPHRDLEKALRPILEETYGLIVYQEQVLETLKVVCGYTYASAALIFDAMRKKDKEKMEAAKPDFVQRMVDRGYSNEAIKALWDTLLPFSDYSFNRAHCASYGVLSYWTAFLKANHPMEYMAAVLSREKDPDKIRLYISETSRMEIPILPPDINESSLTWTPTPNGIRFGLTAIKGIKAKAAASVVAKRPYRDIDDFFRRANLTAMNARVLDPLIRCGAFDSLCPHREDLLLLAADFSERASAERTMTRRGQRPLVSAGYSVTGTAFNRTVRRQWEHELLGHATSHVEVTLDPGRWLNENEFYFIKQAAQLHPGAQRLTLSLGYAAVEVGYVDWNDTLRRQVASIGLSYREE